MRFSCTWKNFEDSMQAKNCVAKWNGCVLATVCLALASAGYGQNPPSTVPYISITMQQAVDLARVKNPTLLSAQQNLLSVKAQETSSRGRGRIRILLSRVQMLRSAKTPIILTTTALVLIACLSAAKSVGGGWIVPARPRHRLMLNIMLRNSRSFYLYAKPLLTLLLPRQRKNLQTTT